MNDWNKFDFKTIGNHCPSCGEPIVNFDKDYDSEDGNFRYLDYICPKCGHQSTYAYRRFDRRKNVIEG